MINTQLHGSKVVAFTSFYTKFLSFMANFTLKVKVKVTSFQGKIPNGSILSLKQIFSKFLGQFDLESQGHKFLE